MSAATLREALLKIRERCVIYNNSLAEEIDAICGNALAEPPRNCDRPEIKTLEDAIRTSAAEARNPQGQHDMAYSLDLYVANWLLSKAIAKKGEKA